MNRSSPARWICLVLEAQPSDYPTISINGKAVTDLRALP